MENDDLARTFNCGIGMAVICTPDEAARVKAVLSAAGEKVYDIGWIEPVQGGAQTVIRNMDTAWQ
jgi:phosphoribosylaminoimidazole (AIR) synthetase